MFFLGLDVGGANLKAALLKVEEGKPLEVYTASQYFPLWKAGKERLPEALNLLLRLLPEVEVEAVGLTMTAEVSDVYENKREGVLHVLRSVGDLFKSTPIKVVSVEGRLIPVEEAETHPLRVASANWAASGWLVSRKLREAILMDVGRTTTSIIPVKNWKVATLGLTDLEKLSLGELVYTGALRTNVSAIVSRVEVRGVPVRVSAEYFACTGDVYLVLGDLQPEDYTVDTPDGRGKSKRESLARLARTVCADLETLGEQEVYRLAWQIAEKQQAQIAEALNQVYLTHWKDGKAKEGLPIVTAGVKQGFLAFKAALKAGFRQVQPVDRLFGFMISRVLPSAAAAFMAAWERLGGLKL